MDWRCGILVVGVFAIMVAKGLFAGAAVDPIAEREWTSDAGTKILASALEIQDGTVVFQLSDGRQIDVLLTRLAKSDQAILRDHFLMEEEGEDGTTSENEDRAGGEFPGEVREGIEAGDLGGRMATLSVYIPSSITSDAKRPAFCYSAILKSSVEDLDKLKAGSEVTGWPVMVSSDLSGMFPEDYVERLTTGWLAAMRENLPIDTERLYGIAYSSGLNGLMMIEDEMGGFDGLITVSGIFSKEHPRQSVCYGMIGLGSSSRVNFTNSFKKKTGHDSLLRYTAEGRGDASADDYEDGMIYLTIQYYRDDGSQKKDELVGFVDRLLKRAEVVSASDPERAYMWMMQGAGLRKNEAQQKKWQDLQMELKGIDRCHAYYEGFKLLQDLGYKRIGDAESSVDEKANERVDRELERIREKLKDTKWVPVIDSF